MMDFFVRESRAVVDGPMAIIRFGTCGGITTSSSEGSIVVASDGSGFIVRNPSYFAYNYDDNSKSDDATKVLAPYLFHKVAPADKNLSNVVEIELRKLIDHHRVVKGLNVTAESFYSSQGRIDDAFDDCNTDIIDSILLEYPNATTLEMETFMLFHLAKCCKIPILASAAAIVVANRKSSLVVDEDLLKELESKGGLAMLEALISIVI
mmetsp:Transcript_25237/g.34725  ORF Transcript_25237/g.34725 Transcript_25237/m.34725 type:complete len:208 (-) Transcript_25237:67-690(-)